MPFSDLADAYRELAAHAAAGRIRMTVERVSLDDAVHAWRHQVEGGKGKLVVCP